ncbi:MAG: ABC transporter permease [Sulfolobales archaeon]
MRDLARVLISDRGGLAALVILISLVLLSLAGPLVYGRDPYQTNYSYLVRVYVVSRDTLDYREIYTLKPRGVIDIAHSNDSIYIVASDYSLERILLKPLSTEPLGRISSKSYLGIVSIDREVYLVERSGESLSLLKLPTMTPIKSFSLKVNNISKVVYLDRDLVVALESPSTLLLVNYTSGEYDRVYINISIKSIGVCWDRYVLVGGERGWVEYYDFLSRETRHRMILTDDIEYIYCDESRVYLLSRFGVIGVLNKNLDLVNTINTGLTEDLVYATRYNNTLLLLGSLGSIVELDPETGFYSVNSLNIRNSKSLQVVSGEIYVIAYGVYSMDLVPPSPDFPLGTDYLGRDLLAQIMIGIRMSLAIALLVAFIVLFIGASVGIVAGYFGGRVDMILSSVINFMYSIPLEPFAILLAMILRPSMSTVIIAISILIWRTTARIIRSQVISVSSTPMIEVARALGASHTRVITRYILPAVSPVLLIDFASVVVYAILAESTLSFLGVGPQNTFTLGVILNQAIVTGSWRIGWWLLTPGVFIGLITFSLYMLIRVFEPIANPRLRVLNNV